MSTINTESHNAALATVKRLQKYNKEATALRVLRAATLIITEVADRLQSATSDGTENAVSLSTLKARLVNALASIGKDSHHGLTFGMIRTLANNVQQQARARMDRANEHFRLSDDAGKLIHACQQADEYKRNKAIVLACEAYAQAYALLRNADA